MLAALQTFALLSRLAAGDSLAPPPLAPDTSAFVRDSVVTGPASPHTLAAPPPDSAAARRRIVREFPIDVPARLHDLRSNQVVHIVPQAALRAWTVDGLADVIALQPGVVAQGEELHVRGGRSGETAVNLDGFNLNEPFRGRPVEVPLLALRGAELVSGAPEAQHATGLAGTLNLHSADPAARPSGELRWQSDGNLDRRHYDRFAGRLGGPLGVLGLGVTTAAEGTFDDTWIPNMRTRRRHEVAGLSLGWRADNRLSGYVKVAPLSGPERVSLQVLVNRQVRQPFHPNFTTDGWVYVDPNLKVVPRYSPVPRDSFNRYRAADHMAITDDRQVAAIVRLARLRERTQASLGLGWLRTRTTTSIGGGREPLSASHRPRYNADFFHVLWGDYSLYRQSDGDALALQGEVARTFRTGSLRAGGRATWEKLVMREMDWRPLALRAGNEFVPEPEDSIRAYDAAAPGGSFHVQGRWVTGGLILNLGARADYFAPGRAAERQTLPGARDGVWSFGPRLGIAYPISVRDAFSLSYYRVHQAPGRDYLYDRRLAITNRQPLGNPALEPATLVAYEGAIKHLFGPTLALQASVFYRDVFGQVGTREVTLAQGPVNPAYQNADESHALGFEWTLTHAGRGERAVPASYVWMTAWGNESRAEGEPYGSVATARIPATGDRPVSWDRRHAAIVTGSWPLPGRCLISWSTSVLSPLPWTPKERRAPFTDMSLVNSERLGWTANTNLDLQWALPWLEGVTLGVEARNVFDQRRERYATLEGYPNLMSNTLYDDYGAYRTETGEGGGAYWSRFTNAWVPVHDERLYDAPRSVRGIVAARW
jgi:outer membrane receptor protein involved in Fe transport